jgi:hypothetical protein
MLDGESFGIPKGEAENRVQRWDYETHFREYALLLGRRGSEALESIKSYPERIELNSVWHGALNRMRDETKGDGHERYSLISYDETAREFSFPEVSVRGELHLVPSDVIGEEVRKAKDERRVTSIVGDIHTHPHKGPFQPDDLLWMLVKPQDFPTLMAGLSTTRENIFAFQTRETEPITQYSNIAPEKYSAFFRDYWLKEAGYKLSKNQKEIYPISVFPNIWQVSLGIAEKHRLALYKGKPNEDLVRIHTDQKQIRNLSTVLQEALWK